MSVSRLSELDIAPPEGQKSYGAPEVAQDDGKLDAILERTTAHLPSENDEPTSAKKVDLDTLISTGLDKQEAVAAEHESFVKSKDSRLELQERYSQGDIAQTIEQYLGWARAFRANPQAAGQKFAESYLSASPYALKPRQKTEPVKAEEIGGKRYSGKVLDSILESAMDVGEENATFKATEQHRAALKEIFPGKTFDEALATIVRIDRDAYADPLATGATLAAAFGLPITPGQEQAAAQRHAASDLITRAEQHLPGMEQLKPAMADLLQRDPRFQTMSGEEAVVMAYQIAAEQHNQKVQGDQWTVQVLTEVARKSGEHVAYAIVDTLKDPAFQKHNGHITAPDVRLNAAMSWLAAKGEQANKHAVDKAKRVKPVKSSSGAIPGDGGKPGLDGAISAALRDR